MDSVDPATYPDSSVFVNLFGERSASKLRDLEKNWSAIRSAELYGDPTLIPLTYDSRHLLHIHKYLFQDVYEWAGKIRGYDIRKGVLERTGGDRFTPANEIRRYLKETADTVRAELPRLHSTPRQSQVRWLSRLLARLNMIHAFPEGNGRSNKLFISHIAMLSGFDFRWGMIGENEYRILMQRTHGRNPDDPSLDDKEAYPLLEAMLFNSMYELEKR